MKKLYFLLFTILIGSTSLGQTISEIDADQSGSDTGEFIEISWTPNTMLDGLVLVLFNGSSDTSYAAFDLDGVSTDANGFYVIGNSGVSGVDLVQPSNFLQNGADAVALYTGNDTDFPNGTSATSTNLIDAIVYGTNDSNDTGLLTALNETTQYNDTATESLQLQNDGTYIAATPTPDATNSNSSTSCGITFGSDTIICNSNTAGDGNDSVTIEVSYNGSDNGVTMVTTTSGGTIGGDNPAVTPNGTITLSGLTEGDSWDITLVGGNCDGLTDSGTINAGLCNPVSAVNVGITGTVDGVYINEIHYDNADGDVDEFFEVAGPAGTDLSDYTISLYNGSDGELYGNNDTFPLSGTIDDEGSGVGAIVVILPANGLQNGGPDGIALSKAGSNDVQFLSYEGVITNAGDGPAMGLTSEDIGVTENQGTPIGASLEYDEVMNTWYASADDTPGDFVQGTVLSNNDFNATTFSLYPNPTNTSEVTISSTSVSDISVTVYDVLGKQVKKQTITNNTLNVSNLKSGIYLLRITQNDSTSTKKLVIR